MRERRGFEFYFLWGKMKEQAINGYHAGIRVDCGSIRQ